MSNAYSFCLLIQKEPKKRFLKDNKSEDRGFEYFFVDTGEISGILGDKPPIIKSKVSVKINKAREIYKRFPSQGWRKTYYLPRRNISYTSWKSK